jgi:hypothetical protein
VKLPPVAQKVRRNQQLRVKIMQDKVRFKIRSLSQTTMLSAGFLVALAAVPCRAGYTGMTSSGNAFLDYFANWFPRVTEIQSEQPHWVTPTVTPRLEEEFRYDQGWERTDNGHMLYNYGSGKGLELIPFDPVEIIIGIPAYEIENTTPSKRGWADETFLVKYRILSGNEQNGNYILTAFMGLSVPSGSDTFSMHHYVFTPTVAFGKGWGNFDIQSTVGYSIPDTGYVQNGSGMSLAFNTTFQYRVVKYLWPEVEFNYTWWASGEHEGLNQLLVTPGLVVGRLPIYGRVGATIGLGCQMAVTDHALLEHNFILSMRIPF